MGLDDEDTLAVLAKVPPNDDEEGDGEGGPSPADGPAASDAKPAETAATESDSPTEPESPVEPSSEA